VNYRLVKVKGGKIIGRDKLRSLLFKTSKWQSREARKELADTFKDRPDFASLRAILLGRKPSRNITQRDMMRICLSWGFKSNIWQRKEPEGSSIAFETANCGGCIDSSHSQPCRVCVSAPEEKEFVNYRLVKVKGDKKRGYHKLRSLICKTSQWQSHEARKELADTFKDRPDFASLRAILLGRKKSSDFTPREMMRICLSWGFKSNIWQRMDPQEGQARVQDAAISALKEVREERNCAVRMDQVPTNIRQGKRSKRKRKSSTWLREQYASDFDNLKEDEDFSRCVGQHVGIWWDLDNCFYYATVLAYNDSDGKCEVLYDDDGVREWLDFSKVRIDWGKRDAQEVGQSSGSPGSSATVATSTMARTFSARPPCKLRSVLCLF